MYILVHARDMHSRVHWCMCGLELEALHLGPGTTYVPITQVPIKPDYFPNARMHDSSILIDCRLGTSVIVCASVLEERAIC